MEFLTDIDEFQAALAKINMNESSLPVFHGRLVEHVETYNKTQQLLNIDAFEKAHPMLYKLNFDELTNEDIQKVDKLYDLACDRGFIKKDCDCGTEGGENAPVDGGEVQPTPPVDQEPFNDYGDEGLAEKEEPNGDQNDDPAKKFSPEELFNLSEVDDEGGEEPKEEPKDEPPAEEPPAEEPAPEAPAEEPAPEENPAPTEEPAPTEPPAEEPPAEPAPEAPAEEPKEEPKEEPAPEELKDNGEKKDDEPKEEPKNDGEEDKPLTDGEKEILKDEYIQLFKSVLVKQELEKSLEEKRVKEKEKFWKDLSASWDKADPAKFLTSKEQNDLDKVVMTK